jgi:hypothetical protein
MELNKSKNSLQYNKYGNNCPKCDAIIVIHEHKRRYKRRKINALQERDYKFVDNNMALNTERQDIVVGVATRYLLDGPDRIVVGLRFSLQSRPAPMSTYSAVKGYQLYPTVKSRSVVLTHHPPVSSAELRMGWG